MDSWFIMELLGNLFIALDIPRQFQ